MLKYLVYFLAFLLCNSPLRGQENYPKGYFIYPVKAPAGLAANFGELRPNHYHMGLDCKTEKRENLPILAAAEGYISKVKIEPYGFGRAIYIAHPNGFSTLYAHLNDFYPELEKYVREQQYLLKKWNVFLEIPAGKFKVKKGQFIAYSGNTGGSQGPHLHFEIRETATDKVLNPLLFGFPIRDNIPPDLLRLAVYDRTRSTYEQNPKLLPLKKSAGNYTLQTPELTVNADKVSFGITAFDKYLGSTNQNGIFQAILFDNEKAVLRFSMDNISYDETRYLNAHIDYKTKMSGGPYIQHLSKLPGNPEGIYEGSSTDGVIDLQDGLAHKIRIEVLDANKNKSILTFSLRRSEIAAAYPKSTGPAFLPGQINICENDAIRFYLPENALYDSFRFIFSKQIIENKTIYKIHNGLVPVQEYFSLGIRPDKPLADTARVIMKWSYGAKDDHKKAVWENGLYRASFRAFGDFELFQDSLPPVITPVGFKNGMKMPAAGKLIFKVTDNAEDIASFNGYVDGKWILFSNDKGKIFIHAFDQNTSPGPHELRIEATDLVGNKTERKYSFIK